jgi:predicted PurR-regulated permease PerM
MTFEEKSSRSPPVTSTWTTQRIARTALIIAVVLAAIWIQWRFMPALAWAAVLAIATWPLRVALARRGMAPSAIAALLTLLLALALVLPLIGLGIEAAHESRAIVEAVRDIRQNGLGTPDWLSHVPFFGDSLTTWWRQNLAEPGAARAIFGRTETSGLIAFTRTLGIEVASRLTILIFTLLALFFLYRDAPRLTDEAHRISDRIFGPPGGDLGRNAVAAVRGTVNGLVLVGLGEGAVLGVAYAATGLSHPVLLGLVTGVLATVPFGAPLVFVACALVLFAESHATAAIVLLVIGFAVVFVADHFIRPILIGNSTRLPFLWVLLGIFGGLESFGLIGLFLGPAIMSVLVAIWRETVATADTAEI